MTVGVMHRCLWICPEWRQLGDSCHSKPGCMKFYLNIHPDSSHCQGPENIICSCIPPCGSWIAYSTASRFFLCRLHYEHDNISLQRVSDKTQCLVEQEENLQVYVCVKWECAAYESLLSERRDSSLFGDSCYKKSFISTLICFCFWQSREMPGSGGEV